MAADPTAVAQEVAAAQSAATAPPTAPESREKMVPPTQPGYTADANTSASVTGQQQHEPATSAPPPPEAETLTETKALDPTSDASAAPLPTTSSISASAQPQTTEDATSAGAADAESSTSNTNPAVPLTAHNLASVLPGHQAQEFGALEIDTDPDRDSAFNEDYESLTTSVNSAVTDYKFENGRRYHAYQDGKYALPNDDEEINRLELQHRVWQLSLSGRLNLAPLDSENVHSAIDIGCGTGAWAIEFGEAFPNTRVLGTDLSPIQPTLVPPNVQFLVDDITSQWVFDHKFDYIHSRAITVGIRDWEKLVDECWRNLEPGGWVEFQEYHAPFASDDDSIQRCPAFDKWNQSLIEATKKVGTHLDAILRVPPMLEQKGFINMGTASTKWPLGVWPKGKREKRLGDLFMKDIIGGVEGVSMRMFTKILGWEAEEVNVFLKDVVKDLRSGRMHPYMPIDFLWAQKPLDAED